MTTTTTPGPRLAETVLRLLDAHWTVARVMDATTWPRRRVEELAANAGRFRLPDDTWVRVPGSPKPAPASTLGTLLEAGDRSPRRGTRALSARVRSLVAALEVLVVQEQAGRGEVAPAPYDVAHVRRWARSVGLEPPERGRFLPEQITQAWEQAGRP